MRVLVCGGRNFNDMAIINHVLTVIFNGITELIAGDASGADSIALEWARTNNVRSFMYPAEWHKYGVLAGPIRNRRMIVEGKPDWVIAFPGGKGTANMLMQAERFRIDTYDMTAYLSNNQWFGGGVKQYDKTQSRDAIDIIN